MKLHVLNKRPSSPCFILKFKDLTVMMDCSLDLSTLLHFMPCSTVSSSNSAMSNQWCPIEVKQQIGLDTGLFEIGGRLFVDSIPEILPPENELIDFSSIAVILITSYCNMLALPFITEYSGFNGRILATEPTLQLGRLAMEELVQYNVSIQKNSKNIQWKNKNITRLLPYPLSDFYSTIKWETLYSLHDVSNSISKVETVGFSQKIDVLGLLQVMPISSGFTIGSSNWVLQTSYHKICYISSSSMFTTHAATMQDIALKNADVCIMNCITDSPTANPDSMLRELCSNIAVTIKNNGNVLIPCFPSGVVYDLFEYICSFMDGSGLSFTPIYFVSPVAHSSIEYANIYAEWLNSSKQSKMYLPEPPFSHHELIKNGRIKHFPHLHGGLTSSFKTPCVVFTGHPSLRYGDVVHFVNLWKENASNTIIFIDSQFPYLDALAPFQPIAMKSTYCPIDPRLNFQQALKLLNEIKPKKLFIPEVYTKPPSQFPQRNDLVISTEFPVETFAYLDILDIPLHKKYEKVTLAPQVAKQLELKQIEAGVAIASVKGKLVTRNNRRSISQSDTLHSKGNVGDQFFGDIDVEHFLKALKEHGVKNKAEVETTEAGHIVHFADIDSMIQLEHGNTHIINHSDDEIRVKIKSALQSCLVKVTT